MARWTVIEKQMHPKGKSFTDITGWNLGIQNQETGEIIKGALAGNDYNLTSPEVGNIARAGTGTSLELSDQLVDKIRNGRRQ